MSDKNLKILFAGELGHGQTSLMRMRALKRLGREVLGYDTVRPWKRAAWLSRQFQKRFQFGPIIDQINAELVELERDFKPDLVWAEKQEFVKAETLGELRKTGALIVHFTPDPYFPSIGNERS